MCDLRIEVAGGMGSLSKILARAEARMWEDFGDAGAFDNSGDIGDAREQALAKFLDDRLPAKYGVVRGEVIDAAGVQSGQTDILIYDSSISSPLLTNGNGLVLLPAEALLATIEVKSTLDPKELRRSLQGLAKLRALQPYASPWGLARRGGEPADDGLSTFFATVFAYSSNLQADDWDRNELTRIRQLCKELNVPTQWVDRVVVLSRGVVLPSWGRVARFAADQQVLGLWFYHLMNFLARESARRPPFPWNYYERGLQAQWSNIYPSIEDAPKPVKSSGRQRRTYLQTAKESLTEGSAARTGDI